MIIKRGAEFFLRRLAAGIAGEKRGAAGIIISRALQNSAPNRRDTMHCYSLPVAYP